MNHYYRTWILILALVSAQSARPDDNGLGRLFFTPEKRLAMDRLQLPAPIPDTAPFTIDGRVRRSSGSHTTWISGKLVENAARLPLDPNRYKVGETVDPASGRHADLLRNGTLSVFRPGPESARQP